jgi:hypothetical protein
MPAVGYGVGIIGGHFARLWNVGWSTGRCYDHRCECCHAVSTE